MQAIRRFGAAAAAFAVLGAACTGSGPGGPSPGATGSPVGSPGTSGAAGPPNVLILLSDDQATRLFTRDLMPNVFSRVVDRGVNFTRAYVNVSQCCPSRSTILTGLYAHDTGVDSNTVPLDGQTPLRPVFPLALQRAGYRTGLFGKYLNSEPCTPQPGWDDWVCATKATEVNPPIEENGQESTVTGYTVDILADKAAAFIRDAGDQQPFFAYYAPKSPHLPANDPRDRRPVPPNAAPSFNALPEPASRPAWARVPPLDPPSVKTVQNWNQRMTQQIPPLDAAIGRILDAADATGRSTLVVFMSDNGFLYGEHRLTSKNVPYEESVRVPLAIAYPPALPPADHFESSALVSNVDLAATVMGAAGIPWESDGRSLLPILSKASASVHDFVLLEWCQAGNSQPCQAEAKAEELNPLDLPHFWGIETERYVYLEYATGEAELYDLSLDPFEMTNLAGDPSMTGTVDELSKELAALRAPPPAPGTTIVGGPAGVPHAPFDAAFLYFSQARTTTFRCSLSGPTPSPGATACDSGRAIYGGLGPGDYRFTVTAVDARGRADPTPAEMSFTVQP